MTWKRAAALTLAVAFAAALVLPAAAQEITEPKSGVKFAAKADNMSLLGVGLRKKAFFKVYAIGFYVADSALAGPLAAHKGKTETPAFYKELTTGDFEKQIVMKFTRNESTSQIQGAFRDMLSAADPTKLNQFLAFFGDTKEGQSYEISWKAGGVLETKVVGLGKTPIADAKFAAAVFGIWLGDKPIQEDIKKGLVSRAGELIK